jgi:hypothetical protein
MSQAIDKIFNFVVPPAACPRCFDSGIWLTPTNKVEVCPRVQLGETHAQPNEASLRLRKATNRLFFRQIWIHAQIFDLARILTNFDSNNPASRKDLMHVFFADTELSEAHRLRKFHGFIEELRKVWLLPIGSRKSEPSGYWIITDLDDFKTWFERVKSAPITQLSTIHKVAKFNFPIFAEQLELEFWNDVREVK